MANLIAGSVGVNANLIGQTVANGQGLSRTSSRFSPFRSRSESRKLTQVSRTRNPTSRKKRRVKEGPCAPAIGTDRSEYDFETEMLRFTQDLSQPTLSSYYRLHEDYGAPQKNYGIITPNPLPYLPATEASVSHGLKPRTTPSPRPVYTPQHSRHLDEPDCNQRRKASMSKLMRHFGETRIPPELVLLMPGQERAMATSKEQIRILRKDRTKSLDLKAFARKELGKAGNNFSGIEEKACELHRTRSLGTQSVKRRGPEHDSLDEAPAPTTHDRVRRTRKMAQIFGPELPYELMASSEHPTSSEHPSMEDPPTFNTNIFVSEPTDLVDHELEPPSPPLSSTSEKRTHKLAKFFGVSQNDIASSIGPDPSTSRRTSSPSLCPPTPQDPRPRDVEVNVKVAGRRFWSFSSDKVEFKHARMTDAIDQLRSLRAG